MKKRKTQEEFEKELKEIHPNIKVLGKYTNTNTKIHCLCMIHNYEFDSIPNNMLRGHGCKLCGIEKNSSSRTKPHDQFVSEVKKINPQIEIIGTYMNMNTYIKCRCLIDGYEWNSDPHKLLKKMSCPVCRNKAVMQGVNDVATTRPDLVKYFKNKEDAYKYTQGSEAIIDAVCPTCGTYKRIRVGNLSRHGLACNVCYERKYGKKRVGYNYWNINTMQEYLNENVPGYIVLDSKSEKNKNGWELFVYIQCANKDHQPYWTRWANIQKGYLCQKCAGNYSNGEIMAEQIFVKHNINFIPQYIFNDCKDQRPLPFDFYLPDYNLIVEIMGEQYESPVDIFGGEEKFEITVMHDKLKRDYLNNHNIDILDIWYYEFNRMENLILNKLASQQLKTITT